MGKKEIIVIGGSAGSIDVLLKVLPTLPVNFPLPIIVVVHRKDSRDELLEGLLKSRSKMAVKGAEDKMKLNNSTIYIAPAGYHLLIEQDHSFSLDISEKINYSRPNIDVTFASVVDVYKGKIIGILLTGANDDGARGMKLIKDAGGYTVIQSLESSMIDIMPEAAETLSKPDKFLSPSEISEFLNGISDFKCQCSNK